MKSPSIAFLVLAILTALATTLSASPYGYGNPNPAVNTPREGTEVQTPFSLRWSNRFQAPKRHYGMMTCNKYPRVCRFPGSLGPHCCGRRCVNVMRDRNNCGFCGKKCKYSEICCKGKCVNLWFNKRHCGSCDNKCNKGSSCVYGMCSYA